MLINFLKIIRNMSEEEFSKLITSNDLHRKAYYNIMTDGIKFLEENFKLGNDSLEYSQQSEETQNIFLVTMCKVRQEFNFLEFAKYLICPNNECRKNLNYTKKNNGTSIHQCPHCNCTYTLNPVNLLPELLTKSKQVHSTTICLNCNNPLKYGTLTGLCRNCGIKQNQKNCLEATEEAFNKVFRLKYIVEE